MTLMNTGTITIDLHFNISNTNANGNNSIKVIYSLNKSMLSYKF